MGGARPSDAALWCAHAVSLQSMAWEVSSRVSVKNSPQCWVLSMNAAYPAPAAEALACQIPKGLTAGLTGLEAGDPHLWS